MTEKEKNLVAEYMAWETTVLNWWRRDDSGIVLVSFDLNDAGLCVKKMQRQEDWDDFITYVEADDTECHTWSQFFAWLYDADYFFESMAAWLKEEKR